VLRLIYAHPLLTREQCAAFLHLDASTIRHLVRTLLDNGLLQLIYGRGDEHLALAEAGLRLLAAALHVKVRYLVDEADLANPTNPTDLTDPNENTLNQRGLRGLMQHLAHTKGLYDLFAELARLHDLHIVLRFWETGTLTVRMFRDHGDWHGIRPDAVAEISGTVFRSGRAFRLFLEYDRGTMHSYDLSRKLERYVRYFAARQWHREQAVPPLLVIVLPDLGEERALHRLAETHLAGLPTGVQALTTTQGLMVLSGLTGAIFLPLESRLAKYQPADASERAIGKRLALFAPRSTPRGKGEQTS
jgi:hypothetical protein